MSKIWLIILLLMIPMVQAGWWNSGFTYHYNITGRDSVSIPRIYDIGSYCINHTARNMVLPYNDTIRIIDEDGNQNLRYTVYNITQTDGRMSYYCVDLLFNKTNVNRHLNYSIYFDTSTKGQDSFSSIPTLKIGSDSASQLVYHYDNSIIQINMSAGGMERTIARGIYYNNSLRTNIPSPGSYHQYWHNITSFVQGASSLIHFQGIEATQGNQTANQITCTNTNNTLYQILTCNDKTINFNLTYKFPSLSDYYIMELFNNTNSYTALGGQYHLLENLTYGNETIIYNLTTGCLPESGTNSLFNTDWSAVLCPISSSSCSTLNYFSYWNIYNVTSQNQTNKYQYNNRFRCGDPGNNDIGIIAPMEVTASNPDVSFMYSGKIYKGISNLSTSYLTLRNYTIQFNNPVSWDIGPQNSFSGDTPSGTNFIDIIEPIGTKSSTNVTYQVNFSFPSGVKNCYFNVTTLSNVQDIAPTSISCNNNTLNTASFAVSTVGDYRFWAYGERFDNNANVTSSSTFTVSIPAAGPSGGGGGGGSSPTLFAIGASCTSNLQCVSGICDNSICVISLCGNNRCDAGETFQTCEKDCSLASNFNITDLMKNPIFGFITVVSILSILFLSYRGIKKEKVGGNKI